ncbi:teichoic acid D-Ala incorporation-associated protein DltX, partial [Staphylococcus haemolyticus]
MIVRCNSALKENNHKMMQYYEKAKPYLLTLLYLAIFIALYLI